MHGRYELHERHERTNGGQHDNCNDIGSDDAWNLIQVLLLLMMMIIIIIIIIMVVMVLVMKPLSRSICVSCNPEGNDKTEGRDLALMGSKI